MDCKTSVHYSQLVTDIFSATHLLVERRVTSLSRFPGRLVSEPYRTGNSPRDRARGAAVFWPPIKEAVRRVHTRNRITAKDNCVIRTVVTIVYISLGNNERVSGSRLDLIVVNSASSLLLYCTSIINCQQLLSRPLLLSLLPLLSAGKLRFK